MEVVLSLPCVEGETELDKVGSMRCQSIPVWLGKKFDKKFLLEKCAENTKN